MKQYFNKQFISNMSHELRSPLNSIISLSRVISLQASDRLDSDEKEYLEIIERNGARLLQLINDLVEVAQIETGIMDINPTSLSAVSIVEDVCDRFEEQVQSKGLSLHRDIEKDLPRVTTDESRLYQVITNLVDNAVKYTEHGSITIRVYSEDERILITVKDTGIGINQQEKSHLFEGYHQGDATLAGKYPGTGLGLTIVSRSAALIHASLSIESHEGEGSSFTVSMPVKWPGEENMTLDDPAPVPPHAVAGGADEKTILVVDDDPDNMTILRALLGREYHMVFTYEGKEGITLAKELQPGLVMLDLSLPDINGLEVLQHLRSDPETRGLPVLIITASAMTHEHERIRKSGCDGFITKPFPVDDLISVVHRLTGKSDSGDT